MEADTQKLSVLELAASPLAPGVSPVRIRYRECGRGAPLVFLHGGWGYEVRPFDRQIAALASTQLCAQLSRAERQVLNDGAHSPHSERATADAVARFATQFLS